MTLNNANAYGNSWKTPPLEMKFKQLHGGATAQRFYSKFPIYRPRHDQPDVHDDIAELWRQTIDLTPQQKPIFGPVESRNLKPSNLSRIRHESLRASQDKLPINKQKLDGAFHGRKHSVADAPLSTKSNKTKTLKLMGGTAITIPYRERFNEEVQSAIMDDQTH